MKDRICTIVVCIIAIFLLAGCAGKVTHIDKDYTLQTEDVTKHKRIELDDYKISNNGIISLKDIIKLNNMNIESVSFYDLDNLLILCTDVGRTRMDVYSVSLDYGTLNWMAAIEGITQYQEAEYRAVRMNPLIIHEKSSNDFWVIGDASVQYELDLDVEKNRTSVVGENYIYYTDSEKNAIKRFNYITGEEEIFFKEIESYTYSIRTLDSISEDGKYLYATGVNKISLQDITCVINIQNSEIVSAVNGRFQCWESDTAIYAGYYTNSVYNIHRRVDDNYYDVQVAKLFPDVAYEHCISNGDMVITVETDGKNYKFKSVDLKSMTTEYVSEIDMNRYYMAAFAEECNYSYCMFAEEFAYNPKRNMVVFEVVSDLDRKNIFLWDISSSEKIKESVSSDGYSDVVNDNVIQLEEYEKITETIESIYDEYGVAVYIGENIPHAFSDYRAEVVNDTYYIQNAVKSIKKVLSYYPRGFFREFIRNNYSNGINIYIVGDMTPLSEEYIDNPAGFTTNMQHYEVIALNVKDILNIEANLCHEIAHTIYKRIKYQEIYSGNIYLDMKEWDKLNPLGFKYYNSYENYKEKDSKYTGENYLDESTLKSIYFVDVYSKTMIEEDLARLMEYGMIKDDEPYLESPNIKKKMKYFYQAIRKVWQTEGWPEETIWERTAK